MTALTNPPPKNRAREWLSLVALLICAAVVAFVTLSPTPLDQGYSASINRVLEVLHRNGVPDWVGYNKLEFSANIAMFVPIGFLVAMLLAARVWWLSLIIAPMLSIAIEVTQSVALTARFATVLDVVANSLGAVVGIMFAVALRAIVYSRDQSVIARALWLEDRSRLGGETPTA